jgi:hypothetical protein
MTWSADRPSDGGYKEFSGVMGAFRVLKFILKKSVWVAFDVREAFTTKRDKI